MNCHYSPTIYRCVVNTKIHYANDCIQLSTWRRTTISNTVVCTLHNFLISQKLIFIHTSTAARSDSCFKKKLRVCLAYILLSLKTSLLGRIQQDIHCKVPLLHYHSLTWIQEYTVEELREVKRMIIVKQS